MLPMGKARRKDSFALRVRAHLVLREGRRSTFATAPAYTQ